MSIKKITIKNLIEKMDQKEDFLLVDCRELPEWNQGSIEGAHFYPLSKLNETHQLEINHSKDQQIIFQCRSGKRSMSACMILKEKGYTNLSNLEGGIMAWVQEGHDIITHE